MGGVGLDDLPGHLIDHAAMGGFVSSAIFTAHTSDTTIHSVSADPSAAVGTSVIVGSAATFMRSDAAPPLNLSITPTWTGLHTFNDGVAVSGGVGGHNIQGNSASSALTFYSIRDVAIGTTYGYRFDKIVGGSTTKHSEWDNGGTRIMSMNNGGELFKGADETNPYLYKTSSSVAPTGTWNFGFATLIGTWDFGGITITNPGPTGIFIGEWGVDAPSNGELLYISNNVGAEAIYVKLNGVWINMGFF